MILRTLYFLLLFLTVTSCEKLFIKAEKTTPQELFNTVWSDYDSHYACFDAKNIDWDSVYTVYNARINNDLNDNQLFELLSEMLENLKDAHVRLETDEKFYAYQKPGYIRYYNSNIINTYLSSVNKHSMFTYGLLEDNIGYFHCSTFFNGIEGYNFLNNILEEFKNCKGIIIDVRANSGGSDEKAGYIASRFYDKPRTYSYFQTRNGPNHSDFSDIMYSTLNPASISRPHIPIVLLTDQSVGSAGEDFTLMLKILPQVTVVGDYTGANPGGAPRPKELQNGWIEYIPMGLQYTMDGELFIDIGMKPDVLVIEQKSGRDMMIEKGIEILK